MDYVLNIAHLNPEPPTYRIGKVGGLFTALIAQAEDVDAGLIWANEFGVIVGALPAVGDVNKVESRSQTAFLPLGGLGLPF